MRRLLLLPLLIPSLPAQDQDAVSPRRPDRFGIVFNLGYAGDHLPKDKKGFERLIKAIKRANFNVVLCKWEDWRARDLQEARRTDDGRPARGGSSRLQECGWGNAAVRAAREERLRVRLSPVE